MCSLESMKTRAVPEIDLVQLYTEINSGSTGTSVTMIYVHDARAPRARARTMRIELRRRLMKLRPCRQEPAEHICTDANVTR